MKFRKKPIVIEAVQAVLGKMADLPGVIRDCDRRAWVIRTLEGDMEVKPGDWVITGVKGERYPCKPDIFAATYEPAEQQAAKELHMREITSHKVNPANDRIKIMVMDEPGAGGANHHYRVSGAPGDLIGIVDICFQNGPIPEAGVNGITQEVLSAIIIDRLQAFQRGPFACRENAIALTHFETGLLWLLKRTHDRMARGVEGTHTK